MIESMFLLSFELMVCPSLFLKHLLSLVALTTYQHIQKKITPPIYIPSLRPVGLFFMDIVVQLSQRYRAAKGRQFTFYH